MLTFKKLIFFIFISLLAHTSSKLEYENLSIWKVGNEEVVEDVKDTNQKIHIGTEYFDTHFVYIVEMEMKINSKHKTLLYSWIGERSNQGTKIQAAHHLADRIACIRKITDEIPFIMRLPEGYESSSAYFGQVFLFSTSRYLKAPILYKVKADDKSSYIVKVPPTVEQLNHNYSFLLHVQSTGQIFIWHGDKTTQRNINAVQILSEFVQKIDIVNKDCEKETEINNFVRILGGSEENTLNIPKELSADDQNLEEKRYSSKYRMIKMYLNNTEYRRSKQVTDLQHLNGIGSYFLMDELTKEKFIYLGDETTDLSIHTVMEEAEKYILQYPSEYPMVRIVRQPAIKYLRFPDYKHLPIPFNPPINFVILFINPLEVINSLLRKWKEDKVINYDEY